MIDIEVRNEEEVRRWLAEKATKMQRQVWQWLTKWSVLIKKDAQTRLVRWDGAGSGGRYTGTLANSIRIAMIGRVGKSLNMATVGTPIPYAKWVEGRDLDGRPCVPRERKAFFHSRNPSEFARKLEVWARRHGFDTENIWGITVGGKKSLHPFLGPAFNLYRPRASRAWKELLRSV